MAPPKTSASAASAASTSCSPHRDASQSNASNSSSNSNSNTTATTADIGSSSLLSSVTTTATSTATASTTWTTEQPSASSTTTNLLTIDTMNDNNNNNNNNNNGIDKNRQPVLCKPVPFSEARDSSAGSRDSLRRHLQTHRYSLTTPELSFLDSLVDHGNEIEVQLAMERLQDEDLFFDYATPKHLKYHEPNFLEKREQADEEEEPRDDALPSRLLLAREESTASFGSTRRLQALENRRTNSNPQQLIWRAHANGLAVTQEGSRKSLLARQDSSSSSRSRSGNINNARRDNNNNIFRPREDKKKNGNTRNSSNRVPRVQHRLSQSMLMSTRTGPPNMPPPRSMNRRSSTSSRKSVTFHQNVSDSPTKTQSNKKLLRRSVSDSLAYTTPATDTRPPPPPLPTNVVLRQDSTSSIPSLHHGHPVRSDSVSSIPSLHHGHSIRQESISSIPSLHHGQAIRQESVSSIPSLHHGHPIRQDSIASAVSIPSLHHGRPIRQDSIGSIPSLHHAHPIRQDSTASTLALSQMSAPSLNLHHGHALQSDVFNSNGDFSSSAVEGQMLLQPPFNSSMITTTTTTNSASASATPDIASAWLQQQRPNDQQQDYFGDLPQDVIISTNNTTTTVEEDESALALMKKGLQRHEGLIPDAIDDDDEDFPAPITGSKPVLMRLASRNIYEGEGIEVTELDDAPLARPNYRDVSMISMDASIRNCSSMDDAQQYVQPNYGLDDIFRNLRKSLSEEDMGNFFLGTSVNLLLKDTSGKNFGDLDDNEDDSSWDLDSESERFDPWNVLKDEYANGYGGGGTLDFRILGTSADDKSAQPHVLSPPLMESLQGFLPYSKSGENFFLKYSMVRDGASLHTCLKRARGIKYSLLALETVDGEVFGSFTGQAWRKNWNYFGTGESFLWKMRRSRLEKTHGILEQAQLESEIDVYPYTGDNRYIQLCTHNRIAVGGGSPSEKKTDDAPPLPPVEGVQDHQWGFGLAISNDFLSGTSSPCVTFGSPSLSQTHSDGSLFEIVNIELWTLTPCWTEEEAEKLELGKLFLERGS